jgi:hypothetical protein
MTTPKPPPTSGGRTEVTEEMVEAAAKEVRRSGRDQTIARAAITAARAVDPLVQRLEAAEKRVVELLGERSALLTEYTGFVRRVIAWFAESTKREQELLEVVRGAEMSTYSHSLSTRDPKDPE